MPDIKKILTMIGTEINKLGSMGEIKLLKENEKYSEEVNLVVKYKKSFWITNTDDPKAFIKEIPDHNIINYSVYFKEMKKMGWQDSKIREEILKKKERYKNKNVLSIIVIPVLLYGNAIGHVSVYTSLKSLKNLRITDVYYMKALADVASEALTKAKLFKLDTGIDYEIEVLNLSAGGAYLEVTSKYIIKFLHEGLHLKIGFKFSGREVETVSEIRRIDFFEESARIALKFIELSAKDQEYIEEYVKKHIAFLKTQKPVG